MRRTVRFVGLGLTVLAIAGCGKPGATHNRSGTADVVSAQNEDDENAVLSAPQFSAPIMLRLGGDAYQAEQQIVALNGVDPRTTYGAAYETDDFSPCSTNRQQVLDNLNPGIDIPADRVALTNALFARNIYHMDTYTIRYPNASSPGYGTSNTYYCAVITESSIRQVAGQPSSALHQPMNIQFGQRVFQAWTYRNRYTTEVPGHGEVKVFAGTFTYAIREDIPLGWFGSFGTANAKAVLNPDTGKWEVVTLDLSDPKFNM